MIRLLFIGDIVGGPGRRVVRAKLESLVDSERVDFVGRRVEVEKVDQRDSSSFFVTSFASSSFAVPVQRSG